MTRKAYNFISKLYEIAKSISLTFSVMLRYIFSHLVHKHTNVSSDRCHFDISWTTVPDYHT